jgi:hypothetical protein
LVPKSLDWHSVQTAGVDEAKLRCVDAEFDRSWPRPRSEVAVHQTVGDEFANGYRGEVVLIDDAPVTSIYYSMSRVLASPVNREVP